MRVRDIMRETRGLNVRATLGDLMEAIQSTGCEALPIVENGQGELVVCQLVSVRDLPRLGRIAASSERGHAVGATILDLLAALGRKRARFPTIAPGSSLADAWGLMSEESLTHVPVVADQEVVGMVSLVVGFAEFPHRSPAAGFW